MYILQNLTARPTGDIRVRVGRVLLDLYGTTALLFLNFHVRYGCVRVLVGIRLFLRFIEASMIDDTFVKIRERLGPAQKLILFEFYLQARIFIFQLHNSFFL